MKFRKLLFQLCLFVLLLGFLCTMSACSNPDDLPPIETTEVRVDTGSTGQPEQTNQPDDAAKQQWFTVDLGGDDIEEEVLVDVTDPQQATIKVFRDNRSTELMSESFGMDSAEKGGYYLRIETNGSEYGELVYWSYRFLEDSQMAFRYEVVVFDGDGNRETDEWGSKVFDLNSTATINSQNEEFLTLRENVNVRISPEVWNQDVFVLVENTGDELVYSTTDHRIQAAEMTFDLWTFLEKN